ncbi:MAG: ZIP family metal transporter [Candidatus Aenigmarchaeota archaeon]|nr:ZIP family metal transporter [Candidatus Aenigmarchaeota archaeon]
MHRSWILLAALLAALGAGAGTAAAQPVIETWGYALGSVVLVSLVAFVGILTLSLQAERLRSVLLYLVGFSAGALLGDAFIHLLPEAVEGGFTLPVSLAILAGIVVSFGFEKLIHWEHGHFLHDHSGHDPQHCAHQHPKSFTWVNLLGDGIHNFIDGLIIGASYLVSLPVGMATTIAVVFHEIPQEIGDFAVLLHGGMPRKRALLLNFLTAVTAIAGAVIALAAAAVVEGLVGWLVPFAAGAFVYIAGSDLIPELHQETRLGRSLLVILALLLGIGMMAALLGLE